MISPNMVELLESHHYTGFSCDEPAQTPMPMVLNRCAEHLQLKVTKFQIPYMVRISIRTAVKIAGIAVIDDAVGMPINRWRI